MVSLIEISRNVWPKLRALCRRDWPRGLLGYSLLDMHLEHPELSADLNFKVYCPAGDINIGMVAISNKIVYELFVLPISKDTTSLENALVSTNIIDWNQNVSLNSMNCETLALLRRVGERLSLRTSEKTATMLIMDKDSELLEISNPPPNTYMADMKPEHLDLIDRSWRFYNPGSSRQHFEFLAKNGLSYVLYSAENHEPKAWIFITESGVIRHLYCFDNFRGKGYATYLTKVVTNEMRRQGKYLTAYTTPNFATVPKLQKWGFEFFGDVVWVRFIKEQ